MQWKIWKSYPILGNRFLLTGLTFLVYWVFFDSNSLVNIIALKAKIKGLEKDEAYYQHRIEDTRMRLTELNSSMDNLEKFARENHHMKRPNEAVYVFVDRADLEQ